MPKSLYKSNLLRYNIYYTRTLKVELWVGNEKLITNATKGNYHLKWHDLGTTAYRDVDRRQCEWVDEVHRGSQMAGDYEGEWLHEVEREGHNVSD